MLISWLVVFYSFVNLLNASGAGAGTSEYVKNCFDSSITSDGFYFIYPNDQTPVRTYCAKGWTTIFNRVSISDYFNKTWPEYLNGFGAADTNYWLGLDNIHRLVSNEQMTLKVEAIDIYNINYVIEYDLFYLSSQEDNYKLTIGSKIAGNLDDAFSCMSGNEFQAVDYRDGRQCAARHTGAWWFSNNTDCFRACLTCKPSAGKSWNQLTFSKVKMLLRPKNPFKPTSCEQIYNKNTKLPNGVYNIYLDESDRATKVYCEMRKGGWTRIMNRVQNVTYEFDKTWIEYVDGFGSIEGNYWMGLRNMQIITALKSTKVRIELWNNYEDEDYLEYESFYLNPESDKFRLTISAFTRGTLNDSFNTQNSMPFATRDKDTVSGCSKSIRAGWWFKNCYNLCLTCVGTVLYEPTYTFKTFVKMMIKHNF